MGFRFRRSIRLLPGVRLNLGLGGVSLSAGVPGASINLGRRGVYGNLGVPGTGMSFRQRLDGGARRDARDDDDPPPVTRARASHERDARPGDDVPPVVEPARVVEARDRELSPTEPDDAPVASGSVRLVLNMALDEHGRLVLTDGQGQALEPAVERRVRREHEPRLREWLAQREREIDAGFDELAHLHRRTPSPEWVSPFTPEPFAAPQPVAPEPPTPGFWDRVLPGRLDRQRADHDMAMDEYARAQAEWASARATHERTQAAARAALEHALRHDAATMELWLEDALDRLEWPRATEVRFALDDDGTRLVLDVDLPELEDVPVRDAAMAARGLKLNVRQRTQDEVRRAYAAHVHAVLFRVVGVAFRVLPSVGEVVASGYSQRRDPATARLGDEYLVSVRVARASWASIDFAALEHLDPVEALARFECVRDLSPTGRMAAIEPLARVPDDSPPGA